MDLKLKKGLGKTDKSRASRIPMNYYRSGPPNAKSSPFVKKTPKNSRARKAVIRLLDSLIITVVLVGLVYSLMVKPTPKIALTDATYHSLTEYKLVAAKLFGQFKNRNKITLDEQGIVNSLKKQFPEIASISVELPLFSETPVVHLVIAQPSFFLSSKGVSYIVDSQGIATSESKNLPNVKKLPTLVDQSGFAAAVGKQVLSAQSVSFINSIIRQTARAKVPIKSLVLPARAEEVDLRTTDHGYFVKFFLGGDANLQSGQFLAARHNFNRQDSQPSEYLDVRVPGKIFYK